MAAADETEVRVARVMMTNADNVESLEAAEDELALDLAAELSGLEGGRLTAEETAAFPDIAAAPLPSHKLFRYLRNKTLQLWHADPSHALTLARLRAALCPPYDSETELLRRVHAFLSRHGFINWGCVKDPEELRLPGAAEKTVLVVGAGIAGLTAARQLHNWGFQVRVVEGRQRLGGRLATYRHQGQTVELGAGVVEGAMGNPLHTLAKQLGLQLEKVRLKCPLVDLGGTPVPRVRSETLGREWERLLEGCRYAASLLTPEELEGVTFARLLMSVIKQQEKKVSERKLEYWKTVVELQKEMEVVQRDMEAVVEEGEKTTARRERDESEAGLPSPLEEQPEEALTEEHLASNALATFVQRFYGHEQAAQWESYQALSKRRAALDDTVKELNSDPPCDVYLSPLDRRVLNFHAAHLEATLYAPLGQLGLQPLSRLHRSAPPGSHHTAPGGLGKLAEGLGRGLSVGLGQAVREVGWGVDGARLSWESSEGGGGRGREKADAVLATLPLGVLQAALDDPTTLRFVPPLPEPKTAAIRRLRSGNLNKVVLVFDKVFWDPSVAVFGHLSQDEGSRGELYVWWGRGSCLVGLVAGEAAEAVEEVAESLVVGRALKVVTELWGAAAVPLPKDSVVTRWRADRWSRGAGPFPGPEASGEEAAALAEPCGRLFWAGDATAHRDPATLHGALRSGLREAARIQHTLLPNALDYSL